ncbi:TPM domain-containing protein [Novosphingobium soli]|uniref:TPM domain-containing protein n=1 Tax=Novosphingobium soli TaxID=574956 RepID=A0ABV6CQ62_9SPHN
MIARAFAPILVVLLLPCACEGAGKATGAPFTESIEQAPGEPIRLQGRVSDAAGELGADAERMLAIRLQALEQATGHQMVVVTIPSLNGADIADYTLALARRWGIGRKGPDDGVVVLLAPNDRKVRIEVGKGLEASLSDRFCWHVIQRDMLPRFKENDFAGGLQRGVTALADKVT